MCASIRAIFFLLIVLVNSEKYCYKWSPKYETYLATKTPYSVVASLNSSRLHYPSCTATKFWMMVRHGTRNPGIKFMKQVNDTLISLSNDIVQQFENGNSSLCEDVVDMFRTWTHGMNPEEDKYLTHEGEDELLEMGERFQNRLPEMFPKIYSSKYQFRSSGKQRAIESMRYFLIGLFGRGTVQSIWPLPWDATDMQVVRFYKNCPKWKHDVDKNPESYTEKMNLINSGQWRTMTDEISRRLGLKNVLDAEIVTIMYTMCAFETAWRRMSPWCGVFTESELKTLELAEDLDYYHVDGYGHPLNYRLACPAVIDLVDHFKSVDGPTTSVSFTHSGTILKLLARFGVYNDSEWRQTQQHDRLWRTSRIDAFASNIAVVLFRCGEEDMFQFLHQERPIPLPGCPKEGLCPLSTLLHAQRETIHNCNFEEMCRL